MKQGYVYILSNPKRTVLYTGVTSDLERRMYQHKHKLIKGFTSRYNCNHLVWWESSESIASAIEREKRIKAGPRAAKVRLIEGLNPEWKDLSVELFG